MLGLSCLPPLEGSVVDGKRGSKTIRQGVVGYFAKDRPGGEKSCYNIIMIEGGMVEGARPTLEQTECCHRFEEVQTFQELAEVVFSLEREEVINGWSPEKPGKLEKGVHESKLKWLMGKHLYHLDEWWIFDDTGQGYNLGKLARQINPAWVEGQSWTGEMTNEEKMAKIRMGWERAQIDRTQRMADALGCRVLPFSKSSMEAGVAAAIVLPKETESLNWLYRGVRTQHPAALDQQVSGMLRTGVDASGKESDVTAAFESWPTLVNDIDIKRQVYQLADAPTEDTFVHVIALYEQKGYRLLAEKARWALDSIQRRVQKNQTSFTEELVNFHTALAVGIIGSSPYVATSINLEGTDGFSGHNGMIISSAVNSNRVSSLKSYGQERLVKGWINRKEVAAIVPVNIHQEDEITGKFDSQHREAVYQVAGQELEAYFRTQTKRGNKAFE